LDVVSVESETNRRRDVRRNRREAGLGEWTILMISARITPKVVWLGLSLNLCAWLAAHMPWWAGLTEHMWVTESAIKTGFLCFAYALALALNLEIAAEYRQTRWLRVAWLALAGNAGVSIIRIAVESSLFNLVWPGYTHSPLWGLLQHLAIVPANAFLLFGLLAMWWAYHQVGLGFSLEKRDYAAIAGILLLLVSLMVFREGLSQALSPYALSRWLQLIGLALLSLSAAASLAPSDPLHLAARRAGSGSGWAKHVADGWPAGERRLLSLHEPLLAGRAVGRYVGGGLPRRVDYSRRARA